MADVHDYPGNSFVEREQRKNGETSLQKPLKKDIRSVVKGEVVTKKKSLGEKFSETFLSSDIETVKTSLLFDILIPAAKDTISEMTKGLIDGLLYGDRKGNRTYRDKGSSRVYRKYDAYYEDTPKSRNRDDDPPFKLSSKPAIDTLIFRTRGDAEEVLSNMIDLIEEYGVGSVKDLYSYAGKKTDYTKEKYGWYDLSSASVERVREGYLLKLPKPVVID